MPDHKFRNSALKPVVALDIDGTLGDYHGHFLRFAAGYCGKSMPPVEEINPGLPLWKHMRVSRRTYRDCKLAYRQGGLKRSMPVFPFASQLTRNIRRLGADIWICTTRPYLRLDNIDPDTREWLRRNRIQYDAVIFGEQKYRELVTQVGLERIVAVADDLPEQALNAAGLGIKPVFLRTQPYNQYLSEALAAKQRLLFFNGAIDRVNDLEELWSGLKPLIQEAKKELQK